MENRKYNISFVTKENTTFSLSLNSNWIICNSTAAEFKKVLSYMVQDTDTEKTNMYFADIMETLKTWNNAEKGNNKTVAAKLKALESVTGKKAEKTDFTKAAETLLKNAKKECTNENTHCAFIDNGYVCVTDSYVAIRTEKHDNYNGYVSENGLNMAQLFTLKSNDICKVYLPDIVTVKKNTTKGKKETYFITEDKTAYNTNYLYNAMLACSFDTNNMRCNAYKIENNNKSLLFIENTETKTNAIVMPVFVRNESDKNVIANNPYTLIAFDSDKNVIGITYLMPGKYPEDVTKVTEDPKKQDNVIEYIKSHVIIPVTMETVLSDINVQQMHNLIHDNDKMIGFSKALSYIYSNLYNNPEKEKAMHDYMYITEDYFMKEYETMHIELAKITHDYLTSDREIIAYGITLKMYGFDLEKYGYTLPCMEDTKIYKISSAQMTGKECRECISNKEYIVCGHSVYMVYKNKNNGYSGKRVYKSSEYVPLVNPGTYAKYNRDDVQRLINRSIKQYYA